MILHSKSYFVTDVVTNGFSTTSTEIPISTTPSETCEDNWSAYWCNLASVDGCEGNEWYQENCQKTCGLCTTI